MYTLRKNLHGRYFIPKMQRQPRNLSIPTLIVSQFLLNALKKLIRRKSQI